MTDRKFPRYRVVSENGQAQGTKLIDVVTGQAIANVRSIYLEASADSEGGLWNCTVELVGVAVDVTVLGDRMSRRYAAVPTIAPDPETKDLQPLAAIFPDRSRV